MNPNKQEYTPIYQIRIKDHLENDWSDWFDNMAISLEADGNTLLSGPIVDQSALYGLLKRVHQLGMQLISINKVEVDDSYSSQKGGKNIRTY